MAPSACEGLVSAAHVHRARAIKAFFEAIDHALRGRKALAKAKVQEGEEERLQYEAARRARAEGRKAG